MIRRVLLAGVAALALAGGPACAAEEATPVGWGESRSAMPFDIIRSLQFLQDQVARGNDRAIRVQALLLRRYGPVFLAAEADVWEDPRNRRAAVLFVLSGGPPAVLEGLLSAGVLPQEQRPLFAGALAYVRNDLRQAADLLSGVDLEALEPGLAAHVHLVLGQILQTEDPAGAAAHLDRARLLAPGGLIEEAALRLETMLVEGLGDPQGADRLARQYFDRYSRSSYAANFEARFAAIFSARGAGGDAAATMAAMRDVAGGLPADRRARLFLTVGRRALVEGRLDFAGLASAEALALDTLPADDAERARLYELAARLGTQPPADAAVALAAIDRNRLHPEDLGLLEAAEQIVAVIDSPPAAPARIAEAPDPAETLPRSPVLDRAERALGRVSADLGTQTP
ncbi:hypothetical protein [Aureimonas mangrovi]|uniref:hypothetical protein n=1 Tax=Aureimonas mangrovi TaxID=2758041 RepID=UPI00163D9CB3|nr:hypothetical protein [Aureimonas mangrovi]